MCRVASRSAAPKVARTPLASRKNCFHGQSTGRQAFAFAGSPTKQSRAAPRRAVFTHKLRACRHADLGNRSVRCSSESHSLSRYWACPRGPSGRTNHYFVALHNRTLSNHWPLTGRDLTQIQLVLVHLRRFLTLPTI
ncbi:unnamed protein product [Soboliphyme baturini]|uniref:Integron gene cassette protein n=1 Tax=Soboliphyme baturini TaxID=241478 RepID=A0A183IQP8_9BILA|nr:unnamed protein product [Soboliphyme baturini]